MENRLHLADGCRNLHTLRLAGCLSTAALMALCEARREGLQLSGNSQLAAPGLAALGAHCGRRARGSRFLSSAQPASLFLRTRKKPGPFPALSF